MGLKKNDIVYAKFKVVGSVSGNCVPTEYILSNGKDTIRCSGQYIYEDCIIEDNSYFDTHGEYDDDDFQWPDDDDLVFYEDEER